MDFQQRKALKNRTSFCFCRRASRFVQKAQEQSKRIKRRLGSSSSIGRDMAGLVESAIVAWSCKGAVAGTHCRGGGRGAPQKSLTIGYTSYSSAPFLASYSLLSVCWPGHEVLHGTDCGRSAGPLLWGGELRGAFPRRAATPMYERSLSAHDPHQRCSVQQ